MTIYTKYQCSVCRRVKDILQDNKRATPNECTITKGCSGFLFPTGETTVLTPTAPVSGVTDWYPRGQQPTSTPATVTEKMVDMSTSSSGGLTLALNIPDAEANANFSVVALFEQQLSTIVPYNQYIFGVSTSTPSTATTTTITGQDSSGKNLRFTTEAAGSGLVFVLINGVASFNDFTPGGWHVGSANQIITNSKLAVGTVVTVAVYSAAPTVKVQLTFTLNSASADAANAGSWSNIRWVEEYNPATGNYKPNKWWLYTCTNIDGLSSSARLRLIAVYTNENLNIPVLPLQNNAADYSGIRFFLSSPPHDNADRYLNFFIDGSLFGGNYSFLTSSILTLSADSSTMSEIYPPFQILESADLLQSFVTADTFSTTDSLSAATPETRLSGSKIIGPV